MRNHIAIRKQLTRPPQLLLACAVAAFTTPLARASVLHVVTLSDAPDCSASGDTLKCHLLQILSFLYVVAGILGFVLILVLAVAVQIYLRNKRSKQARP